MPFAIKCQVCNFGFKVGDEFAGRRGKCPKCGELFQVPAGAELSSPNSPVVATSSPSQILRKARPLDDAAGNASDSVMLRRAKALDDSRNSSGSSIGLGRETPTPAGGDAFPGIQMNAEKSGLRKSTSGKSANSSTRLPASEPAKATADGFLPNLAVADQEQPGNRYRSTRRSGLNIPVWVWFVAGGLGLFSMLGIVAYNSLRPPEEAAAQAPPAKHRANEPKLNMAPLAPVKERTATHTVNKPAAGSPLEDVVEYVENGIVKIDTYDGWERNGLGSGFVIDQSGLVATNYHVVADCVKADVLFNNGVRFGVEGYVAIRPECDLAILKLNGFPENMKALDLSLEMPRNASTVYSIGHPHDYKFMVTNGIVSALPRTSELPESAQEFLKQSMTDKVDNYWIQHNAKIAPGNSGGPLINARGDVIGINTWVDTSIESGFAIHARHLEELRLNPLPSVAPLAQYRRAPQRTVQQQGATITLSSEQIQRLFSENAAKDWQPKSEHDYEVLCELAFLVTYTNNVRKQLAAQPGGIPEEFEPIAKQADDVSQALEEFSWKDETHISAVNTYAATSVFHRGEGVFLFGKLLRTFADKEGRKGMVMNLTGTKEEVFVPLVDTAAEPPAGSQLLVLGVARGSMFMGENPLDQKEVPLVLSYTVLKVAP